MSKIKIFTCLLLATLVLAQPVSAKAATELSGKMVFHNYSSYDAEDSKLYVYDFSLMKLKCISKNWKEVKNPMNARLRKDGKAIVFMGQTRQGEWDIFEYTFSKSKPVNLTKGNGLDDEDPKYNVKGNKIVFKQSNPSGKGSRIVQYDCKSKKQTVLIKGSTEKSMPFYSNDGKKVYYVEGTGKNMTLMVGNTTGNKKKTGTVLYKKAGVQSYYPIASKDGKYLYFSRGYNSKNRADQIIRYDLKTGKTTSLKCNSKGYDCSDACPISSDYIIISSSKSGGKGGYDLYLVNIQTGKMTNLNKYQKKINTSLEELGCDYLEIK
ncbi:TolB family protein [Butyrivibrio sp. YAB3001]|uniref:TolB family protein n=1 Tax=Butyrivibrio sp. YAB3001 TaxID=1520812 RepID=UPI0008F690AB|nr:PD40 domain-containing protein [Butyrivibrio sp. YAB3001]SFB86366.1 WD40-like Beta Propeller Repeat [Butyrivibrio sp. YAB3001]